eukprot:5257693-Amphidinium_carterae.1
MPSKDVLKSMSLPVISTTPSSQEAHALHVPICSELGQSPGSTDVMARNFATFPSLLLLRTLVCVFERQPARQSY